MDIIAQMGDHVDHLDTIGRDAFSDDSAEMIYSIALSFWRNKQFAKAEGVYSFLLTIRPRTPKYLMAAARCFYDMGDYRRALSLYSYAGVIGADPATSVVRAGQCYIMIGQNDNAAAMFNYIVQGSKKDPSFASEDIVEQAAALLSILSGAYNSESKDSGKINYKSKSDSNSSSAFKTSRIAKAGRSAASSKGKIW